MRGRTLNSESKFLKWFSQLSSVKATSQYLERIPVCRGMWGRVAKHFGEGIHIRVFDPTSSKKVKYVPEKQLAGDIKFPNN